ncbi:MAG: M4 family metallopeptidase, partial [Methylovulum sp.]
MNNFWRVGYFLLLIIVMTITPIRWGVAANATLLTADAHDLRHFTKSKNKLTGNLNFLATARGYAVQPSFSLRTKPTKEQVARSFLAVYGKHFGLQNEASELMLAKTKETKDARKISRFKQVYKNIPVYGAELVVDVDSNNALRSINGNIASTIAMSTTPTVAVKQAQRVALAVVAKQYQELSTSLEVSKPELVIFNAHVAGMNGGNENLLAWKCVVSSRSSAFITSKAIKEQVLIDAHNEKIINHFTLIAEAKNRLTYDYQNLTVNPMLLRSEGQDNINDSEIDNAHNFAGDTYDFYAAEHHRDSIDDAGLTIKSNVRYSTDFCNAFWNGLEMTYGDGCSIVVDDIVAHELTHGVTQYESALIYQAQSGAINEAFSDIWGEFVDLSNGQGTDTAEVRWLMGEDNSVGAFRSMKNPTDFGNPDRIKSNYYYCGIFDNYGVHYNSGVINKTAYLITDGDTFNGYTITGLGVSKTADLFYEVQTNILTSSADYSTLYAALNQACVTLNYSVAECQQVNNAGLATELNLTPCIRECVASHIAKNSVFTGMLDATDCLSTERSWSFQDVFTFDVTAGEEYVITMNSTDFDVYFYVLSGSDIVAFDDDSNGSYNAKVVYTPINSGSLSLHATSYQS